jgi:hypothetical protein
MFGRLRDYIKGLFGNSSSEPMKLPGVISDNQYLASSANAALVDRASGAYDKYLFAEREIPEMPYETAVDEHLDLMGIRLQQRFRRTIGRAQIGVIRGKALRARSSLSLSYLTDRKESLDRDLSNNKSILNGQQLGKSGVYWPGSYPDFTNLVGAWSRILFRYLAFLVVGVVDIFIVYRSIASLGIQFTEAAWLTAPAVAAQLIFPHLIGTRLALLFRGAPKKLFIAVELFFMLSVWLGFVGVISIIRTQFIIGEIATAGLVSVSPGILTLLAVVLLVALGGWLIFQAVRDNPHEADALRLQIKDHRLGLRIIRTSKRLEKAEERLLIHTRNLENLNEEVEDAVLASRSNLGQAAKAIYRRTLVNETADPDFTSQYLRGTPGAVKDG